MKTNMIEYNRSIYSQYQKICGPLMKYYGLGFDYYKVYFEDYRYFAINGSLKHTVDFAKHINHTEIFCKDKKGLYHPDELAFTLWPQRATTPCMEINLHNDMWHGLSISRIHASYLEVHCFYTSTSNTKVNADFYLRNKETLTRFISYFNKRASHIINSGEKMILPRFKDGFSYEGVFMGADNARVFEDQRLFALEISEPGFRNLTPREHECLKSGLQGNSAKTTARLLNLSMRTVESYLDNAKVKLSCNNKVDLLNKYYKFLDCSKS